MSDGDRSTVNALRAWRAVDAYAEAVRARESHWERAYATNEDSRAFEDSSRRAVDSAKTALLRVADDVAMERIRSGRADQSASVKP